MSTIHFDLERISLLITTSGKTGSADMPEGMAEEIRQVVCVPAISNNMYIFRLLNKDDSDMVMWQRSVDGTLNELVNIPVYGNYKATISGATSDDTFKIRLLYK